MLGLVYLTGLYCLIQLALLKTDLIDSGMANLLYMILKPKFKEPGTEVGIRY